MAPTKGAAAYEFVLRWFGHPTTHVESFPAIAATSAQLLASNPRRLFWYFQNLDTQPVFLAHDNRVAVNKGVLVSPQGGFASMQVNEDGEAVTLPVVAIASAAITLTYLIEVFAE